MADGETPELVERARDGDREAFEALVRSSFPSLLRFCGSLAHDEQRALDLAQETVLRALTAIRSFRAESRFTTWLMTIARNVWLNERARHYVRREKSDEELDRRAGRAESPVEIAAGRELEARLEEAVAALPEDQRLALLLCDRDGLSYKQISEVMGCPLGTVMSRLHRGRRLLKSKLAEFLSANRH